ncbi:hypothetical protein [Streptomyces sp. Root1310]|uniref:hypothetical protein n=1 Tax=Streptomyces sp. Root1310 TaxID=1736452 RepID=UPI00070C53BA|nr:hypothetical protein [Streptomyces sp. Root1310]KQX68625.1 hypothetical protein ASD48_40920 [Streptomyces sp. Root1310]
MTLKSPVRALHGGRQQQARGDRVLEQGLRIDDGQAVRVPADLPGLGAGPAGVGAALGGVGPVVLATVGQDGAVAADFAADRRWASAQFGGDRPDGGLLE